MDIKDRIAALPGALLPWYEKNRRDLPWRQDRDPYHIWISEIMLQQTRVEAVKNFYSRFVATLPTISALAACDDELLHKLWEGLGYYSRVRNLKKAAIRVMEDYGGVFPREYPQILDLPGIGAYTAGAICSIAYDMPTPAVDGNVLRVYARVTDDATPIDLPAFKKATQKALGAVYPREAGAFTQALMELGATLCGPNRAPDCGSCPCKGFCLSCANGTAEQLPVKSPKRGRRKEDMTVFLLRCRDEFALQKRPAGGLLANLWQFPNTPSKLNTNETLTWMEDNGLKPKEIIMQMERKHAFTHIEWDMRGVYVRVADKTPGYVWRSREQINAETALPTAFRLFWDEIQVFDGL